MYPVPVPLPFTILMNWHQQHLLQSGKSGPTWEVADLWYWSKAKWAQGDLCFIQKAVWCRVDLLSVVAAPSHLWERGWDTGWSSHGQTCQASHVLWGFAYLAFASECLSHLQCCASGSFKCHEPVRWTELVSSFRILTASGEEREQLGLHLPWWRIMPVGPESWEIREECKAVERW